MIKIQERTQFWDEIKKLNLKWFDEKSVNKMIKKPEVLPAQADCSSTQSQTLKKEELKAEASYFIWTDESSIKDRYRMKEQIEKSELDEEKYEIYLEKKNMHIASEMHNKISDPAIIESENVKDSISLIINQKRLENVKEPKILKNTKNKTSQKSATTNDLNRNEDIDSLRNKTAEILSRSNNQELEIDFRAICSADKNNSTLYDPPLMQVYQDYLSAYQQETSLYNLDTSVNQKTYLYIYNTETETQEVKILHIREPLDLSTCITQLPNGKLFCFGKNNQPSGITMLIDVNGGVEVLPSGAPCCVSSCIYFNNSVYCFGGWNNSDILTLSSRFDLDQHRWIQLAPMPKADSYCNSIIFNWNILISGRNNRNLLLYSIELTLSHKFLVSLQRG